MTVNPPRATGSKRTALPRTREGQWIRRAGAVLALAVLASIAAGGASVHGPGSGTITSTASFVLTPAGTNAAAKRGKAPAERSSKSERPPP